MAHLPTEQEIRDKLERSPEHIRAYVLSQELISIFEELRVAYKLHFDEAAKVSDAIVAVFVELRPASEFPNLLKEALEQNSEVYEPLLNDINKKIFTPFRESLEQKNKPTGTPESAQSPAVQQPKDTEQKPSPAPASPLKDTATLLEKTTNKGEERIDVGPLTEEAPAPPAGDTEPTQNNTAQYKGGNDPYREPID